MNKQRSFWVRNRVALGYPLAALCLWFAHPTWRSVLGGTMIAVVGLLIRGAAAGVLRKGQALSTLGPYARTRNPLYFGSGFLAAGFSVASHSWLVGALLMAFFGATYYAVMRREENDLRVRYGQAFEDYSRRVPLFWPRLGNGGSAEASAGGFSWAQYLRNREYRAGIGVLLLMLVFGAMALWRR